MKRLMGLAAVAALLGLAVSLDDRDNDRLAGHSGRGRNDGRGPAEEEAGLSRRMMVRGAVRTTLP
jgi:hypothetical protein